MSESFDEPAFALEVVAEDLLHFAHLLSRVELFIELHRLLFLLVHKLGHFLLQVRLVVIEDSDYAKVVLGAIETTRQRDSSRDRFNHIGQLLVIEGSFLALIVLARLLGVLTDLRLDLYDDFVDVAEKAGLRSTLYLGHHDSADILDLLCLGPWVAPTNCVAIGLVQLRLIAVDPGVFLEVILDQTLILVDHLCQLVDVSTHEHLVQGVTLLVKRLNSLPDQLELAQFVLELVLVLLSDLA